MSTPPNILVAEPKIYFDPSYSHVPDAMKKVDQWLAFLVKWNPETEHFDKTPLNSSGRVDERSPRRGVLCDDAGVHETESEHRFGFLRAPAIHCD